MHLAPASVADMTPLDLRAVEARHKATMNGFSSNPGAYVESAADMAALLAHCRALRAVLQDVVRCGDEDDVRYEVFGAGDLIRLAKDAALVLAASQEGES